MLTHHVLTHAAESRPASEQMLAQALLAMQAIFSHHPILIISKGVWGLAPMFTNRPWPFSYPCFLLLAPARTSASALSVSRQSSARPTQSRLRSISRHSPPGVTSSCTARLTWL